MKVAILGLGKMGSRLAEKLLQQGHELVVWNRTFSVTEEFQAIMQDKHAGNKLQIVKEIDDLAKLLEHPRIFWLMLPAGKPTDAVLEEVKRYAQEGDIIIDGGNAKYTDTERRYAYFSSQKILYLGIGVSGGILAEKNGYPMMVGGNKEAYDQIKPILDSLSKPNGGHAYLGMGGAGHFAKMVHNGIEYGMMQAIGEGFGVLEKSTYNFDLLQVAGIWQKGTIISSFLIDRAKDVLEKDKKLSDIVGVIQATGEAEWTVDAAKEEDVPVPVIEESLRFRHESDENKTIQNSFAAKMVAALRREFGGHEVKQKE